MVDLAQIGSSIVVGVALFYTAKTYMNGKKLEQLKLGNDILKDLKDQISKLPQLDKEDPIHYDQIAFPEWFSNYFNTWEWYCFLVNHKHIDYGELKDFFKDSLIHDYREIFKVNITPKQKADRNFFKEFRILYERLTGESTFD